MTGFSIHSPPRSRLGFAHYAAPEEKSYYVCYDPTSHRKHVPRPLPLRRKRLPVVIPTSSSNTTGSSMQANDISSKTDQQYYCRPCDHACELLSDIVHHLYTGENHRGPGYECQICEITYFTVKGIETHLVGSGHMVRKSPRPVPANQSSMPATQRERRATPFQASEPRIDPPVKVEVNQVPAASSNGARSGGGQRTGSPMEGRSTVRPMEGSTVRQLEDSAVPQREDSPVSTQPGGISIVCPICTWPLRCIESFHAHIETQHGSCTNCDRIFLTPALAKRHVKNRTCSSSTRAESTNDSGLRPDTMLPNADGSVSLALFQARIREGLRTPLPFCHECKRFTVPWTDDRLHTCSGRSSSPVNALTPVGNDDRIDHAPVKTARLSALTPVGNDERMDDAPVKTARLSPNPQRNPDTASVYVAIVPDEIDAEETVELGENASQVGEPSPSRLPVPSESRRPVIDAPVGGSASTVIGNTSRPSKANQGNAAVPPVASFGCPHCDKEFSSPNSLITHIRWIHRLKQYICRGCKTLSETAAPFREHFFTCSERNLPTFNAVAPIDNDERMDNAPVKRARILRLRNAIRIQHR